MLRCCWQLRKQTRNWRMTISVLRLVVVLGDVDMLLECLHNHAGVIISTMPWRLLRLWR